MYNIFLNNIKAARKLKTQKNIAEVSLSIFRMLIQHICISNAEYINILAKELFFNFAICVRELLIKSTHVPSAG